MIDEELQAQIVAGRVLPVEDGPDRYSLPLAGGQVELFGDLSPDKEADNQDSLMVVELDANTAVLAVADGAGGIQGGRRASRLALETLRDILQATQQPDVQLRTVVLNAIEQANSAVINATRGAACTLTVISVEGRTARVFHVGDSVALITGQRSAVKLQTVAHSPVGFAVAAGFLTEEDAMYHPERHVVSNFVGTHEMVIEVGPPVKMAKHDSILLASDGLTDNLHMPEILALMRRGAIDATLDEIVALAQQRMLRRELTVPGKADDLSVILFRKPNST